MALFVEGENVSAAWVDGLDRLLSAGGEAVNLTVAIVDPTTEVPAVRSLVDAFIDERRRRRPSSVERISTVANTIFPQSLYIEPLGEGAENHLYDLERRSRRVTRVRNRQGTYFERMVAWPIEKPRNGEPVKTFNQLDQAVTRLRRLHEQGVKRGNQFEIGLATPADQAIAVPIVVPGRDRQTMGFPCLSHMSLSLQKGVVHMTAIYRNHEFIKRGYGNYVGLGRLLRFVAQQSGWPVGELTCVSASAAVGSGAGFSGGAARELMEACRRALKQAS
ncbi:MAG TPA: hypothetical protein VNH38_04520 [Candidatus Dormibacteraeota bacterium]|nr:hypothetical protein [Candidatus Dormibacteraeota bacterium]